MSRSISGRVVLALLAVTVVMLGLFEWGNRSVYPHGDGVEGMPTILDLQLSFSESNFRQVLDLWSGIPCTSDRTSGADCIVPDGVDTHPDGVAAWKRNTVLFDFVFPLVYSAFFVVALVWVWRPTSRWGRWLVAAGSVAAASDFVENSLHLWVLRDVDAYADLARADLSATAIALASAFSSVKWGLIAVASVGLVTGAAVRIGSTIRARRPSARR